MAIFSKQEVQNFREIPFHFIKTRQDGNLFTITLNRPEKKNAFTPTMVQEIAFAISYAQHEKSIWCLCLEAEGNIFCAGMDLNVFQNPSLDIKNDALPATLQEISLGEAFRSFHKPSVAKVQGSVFAGGFLVIGGCNFVVATEDAEFSLPEVKRGIFPLQVMATLLTIMSPRKAMEMSILAKTYSAKEAYDLGLVTHLTTPQNLRIVCNELISSILENSPFAIQKGMEIVQALSNIPADQHFVYLMDKLQTIRLSEDSQEGINAFREKRKPLWKNN